MANCKQHDIAGPDRFSQDASQIQSVSSHGDPAKIDGRSVEADVVETVAFLVLSPSSLYLMNKSTFK